MKRDETDGSVIVTGCVELQRVHADRGVVTATCIAGQRFQTNGCVENAIGITE